jgi:streptogramin lyase
MKLQLSENTAIANLRHYPDEVVEKLKRLLTAGAQVQPDPHRQGFYDLDNGSQTYFIHVAPSGKVWLLGSWRKDGNTSFPEKLEPTRA